MIAISLLVILVGLTIVQYLYLDNQTNAVLRKLDEMNNRFSRFETEGVRLSLYADPRPFKQVQNVKEVQR